MKKDGGFGVMIFLKRRNTFSNNLRTSESTTRPPKTAKIFEVYCLADELY